MTSVERPRPIEQGEKLHTQSEMLGVQGRFILADQRYLNPAIELPETDELETVSFLERDYTIFDESANCEGKQYWETYAPNTEFQYRYRKWASALVKEINKRPQEKWQAFFRHIGIDTTKPNTRFTRDHAGMLYWRYFNPEMGDNTGIKRFVTDMLSVHTDNNKINYNKLEQNISEIKWLANIFGEKSAEVVAQLTLAEAKLITQPDRFIKEITTKTATSSGSKMMRINNLGEEEKKILQHITQLRPTQEPKLTETANPQEHSPEEKNPLPTLKKKKEIQKKLLDNDILILLGGPGSGKTSGTPPMVREFLKPGELFYITEPRQANTQEVAKRVAAIEGVTLGKEVGFQHGNHHEFDRRLTDTLFVTERILINRLLRRDRALDRLTYVMVDEVHVQNTDTEILLGLLKKEQERRKNADPPLPPLKIIIVSATADKEKLQRYFNTDNVIEIEGKMHPVQVEFRDTPLKSKDIPQAAAQKTMNILQSPESQEGDIAIALAGTKEIAREHEALSKHNLPPNIRIIPLHRDSEKKHKEEVGKKAAPGQRRIINATNVIDTGVTINGLKYLINSGEKYEKNIDPESGFEYMKKVLQSIAECTQWEGRVGRISPGFVYHCFTYNNPEDPKSYKKRPLYPTAEIERTDLTEAVLLLKNAGQDLRDLELLSAITPEQKAKIARRIDFSEEVLKKLGALTQDGEITKIGREMKKMSETYRINDFHAARMLVAAKQEGKGFLDVYTIIALMEEKNLFSTPEAQKTFNTNRSDFLTYLTLWKQFEIAGMSYKWAKQHGVNYTALKNVGKKRENLLKENPHHSPASASDIERFAFEGYRDRLMKLKDKNERTYSLQRDKKVSLTIRIDENSAVNTTPPPEYIIAASNGVVSENDGQKFVTVSNCQHINPLFV